MVFSETEKQWKKEFKENLRKKPKGSDSLVIEINGNAIGMISLNDIIPKLKAKSSSWIGKEYRGKGIMTKAKRLVLPYWFKKYRLRRIYALCRIFNKASARALEKSGYKREGVLRKNTLKRGKYHNDYMYAIIK